MIADHRFLPTARPTALVTRPVGYIGLLVALPVERLKALAAIEFGQDLQALSQRSFDVLAVPQMPAENPAMLGRIPVARH